MIESYKYIGKLVCILKNDKADLTKYGLQLDGKEWNYYDGCKRIMIHPNGKVVFNCMTIKSIAIACKLYQDGIIDFANVSKFSKLKKHCIFLDNEEYEFIMKEREKKKNAN